MNLTFISMMSKCKALTAALPASYFCLHKPAFSGCVALVADCSTAKFIWVPGVNVHKHSNREPTEKKKTAEGWVMHLINNARNQQYWAPLAAFAWCPTFDMWRKSNTFFFLSFSCVTTQGGEIGPVIMGSCMTRKDHLFHLPMKCKKGIDIFPAIHEVRNLKRTALRGSVGRFGEKEHFSK